MKFIVAFLFLFSPLHAQWEESATLKKIQGKFTVTHSTESWFQAGYAEHVKDRWMWEDLDGDDGEEYIYSLELKKEGRKWFITMQMTNNISSPTQALSWGGVIKTGELHVTEIGFTVQWKSGDTTTFIRNSELNKKKT